MYNEETTDASDDNKSWHFPSEELIKRGGGGGGVINWSPIILFKQTQVKLDLFPNENLFLIILL